MEIERAAPAGALAAALASEPARPAVEALAAAPAEAAAQQAAQQTTQQASATGFAFSHLIAEGPQRSREGVLHLSVMGETHVRQSALLAAAGGVRIAEAHRRRRGRLTDELLGSLDDPFVRCLGDGELWLTVPPGGR